MNSFGIVFIISLLFICTGCGGLLHLDAGVRQSTYQEKPKQGNLEDALSQASNRTIVITEGEKSAYRTTGTGFHYGFSYETQFLMQKYNSYSIDYDPLDYSYSINGSTPVRSQLKVRAEGHDYMAGFKIGILRPRISFKREDINIVSFSGTTNDSFFYMGYGIGIDFHLFQGLHLYAGYDKRYRIASDPLLSISTTDITFGVLLRPWDWISFGSGKAQPRFFTTPFFEVF